MLVRSNNQSIINIFDSRVVHNASQLIFLQNIKITFCSFDTLDIPGHKNGKRAYLSTVKHLRNISLRYHEINFHIVPIETAAKDKSCSLSNSSLWVHSNLFIGPRINVLEYKVQNKPKSRNKAIREKIWH